MTPTKVVLLACGSFNPPTNMHLRMFGKSCFRLLILFLFYFPLNSPFTSINDALRF